MEYQEMAKYYDLFYKKKNYDKESTFLENLINKRKYFEGAPLLYTLEPTILLLLLLLYLRDILNTRKFQFARFRWSHTEFNGQLKFI